MAQDDVVDLDLYRHHDRLGLRRYTGRGMQSIRGRYVRSRVLRRRRNNWNWHWRKSALLHMVYWLHHSFSHLVHVAWWSKSRTATLSGLRVSDETGPDC